jgi:hypothetical protein
MELYYLLSLNYFSNKFYYINTFTKIKVYMHITRLFDYNFG